MYQSDSFGTMAAPPNIDFVWLSMLLAILLNLFPYPDQWYSFKPDFVALMLVHWALRPLFMFSYSWAFILGIISDVAYTAHLGQHAFAYAVILLIAGFLRNPYVIAGRLARAVYIFIALGAAQISVLAVSMVFESVTISVWLLMPAFIGAVLWLLVPILLLPLRSLHAP